MSMVISAAYVLRNAYSGNSNFKSAGFRANSNNHDVVHADRRALDRALDRLGDLNFDFDEDDENSKKSVYNTVSAYIDIYNNTIDSTKNSSSSDIQRTTAAMKKVMKGHADELEEMGITIKSDGTLKVDKSKFKDATPRQLEKMFSDENGHITDMKALMKKLRSRVGREVPRQDPVVPDGSTFSARV